MKEPKQRTPKQNDSMHLGFRQVAEELNEKNYSVEAALEAMNWNIEVEWTEELVKEILFKRIAKIMYGVDSTKDLKTVELQRVWEAMSRGLAKTGVCVEFPSEEPPLFNPLP